MKPTRLAATILGICVTFAVLGCRATWLGGWCVKSPVIWECSSHGLDPELLEALRNVAAQYAAETGHGITITSGRRTLRKQAELMAEMTRAQLEGMYCSRGYPSYVRDLVAFREQHGRLSNKDAYRILRERTEGYISTHLSGAAVDISSQNIDVELLKQLLETEGFRTLDERNLGIDCVHATFKAAPVRIVRE